MDFLYFVLYVLFWGTIFLCVLAAALILTVLVGMIVGGVKWMRYTKRRSTPLRGSYSHSDAEDDESPFSDFEEAE